MMKPQRGKTPRKPPRHPNAKKQTDPVEVYCRIRPLPDPNIPTCAKVIGTSLLQLSPPEGSHAARTGKINDVQYKFQYVFDEFTSQKALFDYISLPLAEDVLKGKNALLFAYGVTGSGKTHTMTGSPQDQGVLPRCLDVLFNSIGDLQAKKYVFKPDRMNGFDVQTEADAMIERQRRDILPKISRTPGTPREKFDNSKIPRVRDPSKYSDIEEDNNYAIFVSYAEIYNNYIYDLLEDLQYDPIVGHRPPQSKILREDCQHNMYISGITEVEVKSTEEAYEVLWRGQKRRKVAHTALNTESSRSHSVFNIRLVQAPLDPIGEEVLQDKEKICVSQLSLVDLAGSERTSRTGSGGDRLREAGNINQSLMVLKKCMEMLRENQQTGGNKMVPFRDSKLTHLFKNYFDGEGKVRMVVCVNPKSDDFDETVHVMRFAEMTQEVQVARPEVRRIDTGLTPGRRRLNKQYKEAVAMLEERGGDVKSVPVPEALVYSLGPPFPDLELKCSSDVFTISQILDFLQARQLKRTTLLKDFDNRQEQFRARLVEMEAENVDLKAHNQELQNRVAELEGRLSKSCDKLERENKNLKKTNTILQRTTTMYEQERRDLEREIGEKEWKILQEKTAKDILQQDYQAKLVLKEQNYSRLIIDEKEFKIHQTETEKNKLRQDYKARIALKETLFTRNIEREKRKVQEDAMAKLRSKQHKLEMVKNILLDSDADSASTCSSVSSTPRTRPVPATRTHLRSKTASENNISTLGTPRVGHNRAVTALATVRRPEPRSRRGSPPPVKPKPVMNPRYHRRSKSQGEAWLEHKPNGTVDTGTLLQPTMKKRRSVTNLREKDTKVASKYVLQHQTIDSDGDVATKFVKGDMIPTSTGGTAVVFNDIETLKQTSPGAIKRHANQERPEDYDGEWTDAEDRCKTAIEHHGHLKRVKISNV